ncbi:MAG: hypothetical protein ACWA40_06450 [Planktomarina sp.]
MTEIDFPNERAAKAFEKAREAIIEEMQFNTMHLDLSGRNGFSELTAMPEEIYQCTELTSIDLSSTNISDNALDFVSGMHMLCHLDLSYTKITDDCGSSLNIFPGPGIILLDFTGTKFGMKGLKLFAEQFLDDLHGCDICLEDTPALQDPILQRMYN